ncbi:1-deoxy-D-xylulose-5-phosphate synthase N-terminal domain-containing protein [Methylotenera sp.]|uniref:1-deoxy-D-xylulose-5-phosphate synthase N-terminal domain-containing protein n=1 Tax=Methylotenera sp. TaxID=2051956 RepID=UPI002ED8FB30
MKILTSAMLTAARKRLIRMHFDSGVGHIGGNLSALDSILLVFHEYLGENDKFILSKGHSAGALYVSLWSVGRLDESQLALFHKDDTLLAGHPPAQGIADIPFSTGSLGHGLSLAAGTALGFRLKNSDAKVICLTSDGEWQEGSMWEALIFSCHHKLSNLTVLIDHNNLQGFGSPEEVASMSPLWERFKGFDADIQIVDGHDISAIRFALSKECNGLKIVILKTIKGRGISFMENRMDSHYLPLSEEQFIIATKELC